MKQEIFNLLIQILTNDYNYRDVKINENTNLYDDLHIDDIDMVEILMSIEEGLEREFDITEIFEEMLHMSVLELSEYLESK